MGPLERVTSLERVGPVARERPRRPGLHLWAAGLAAMLALVACDKEKEKEPDPPAPRIKQVFHLNAYEKDFGYSQAVLIDKTLYISGSVAADAAGRLVAPGDMAGQMRAAYSNIQQTLAAHGASFEEVVKETIYTTDMDALLKASDVRLDYYNKELLPATSWVQVQRLVDPGFLVEIEVVAELP
jgi:2-iminobutanoate/2-iminopropanoate deaminase